MYSRYLVIALAFGAAAFKAVQGAWVETASLLGLGTGLLVLRLSVQRPFIRGLAYLAFALTALCVVIMLARRW